MDWKTMLAYVTGSVDAELLGRNEYLVAENRILRAQIPGRLKLTDGERRTLAQIGKPLGRKALPEVANIVRPDTILAWHRRLVARKFDGSKKRHYPGRPRVDRALENLIVRLATENRDWGYDRIAGALANLGHEVSDQTVGNILRRQGIPTAPERKKTTTWKEFIRAHRDVLAATDFFTAEVWTLSGLVTYCVLFVMHVSTRRVHIAGLIPCPNEPWMTQVARNLTMADVGFLVDHRYLIHDRDGKYCPAFDTTLTDGGVTPVRLPPRSPSLNPHAELGAVGERRVPLEADPLRRAGVTDRVARVRRALSRRAQSPGQRQSLALSAGRGRPDRSSTLPRAPRGPPEVLPPSGRMSFLTTRASTLARCVRRRLVADVRLCTRVRDPCGTGPLPDGCSRPASAGAPWSGRRSPAGNECFYSRRSPPNTTPYQASTWHPTREGGSWRLVVLGARPQAPNRQEVRLPSRPPGSNRPVPTCRKNAPAGVRLAT